ncbi:MAG: D-alanyl-D-alanine carboxypeptidase family protein [Kiritimatiellia bacterium]
MNGHLPILLVAALGLAIPTLTSWGRLAAAPTARMAAPSAYRKTPYCGAISADAATGRVLFADRSDAEAYPASVTKLMTALLVLEDVEAGRYKLTDRATATPDVNRCEASWVGLRVGESMTIDDLLMALLVNSANDAAIVLGVHSAGSATAFVARMNARAASLGMTRTRYFNPHGLPAPKYGASFNRTTAADQLKLALEIVRHPQIYRYTSTKVGEVKDGKGKPLKFVNHNNVMVKNKLKIINADGKEAVDGLKTGYIDAGGSSVVLTGTRNGKRAIVIVLGSSSSAERDTHARRLMEDALEALVW